MLHKHIAKMTNSVTITPAIKAMIELIKNIDNSASAKTTSSTSNSDEPSRKRKEKRNMLIHRMDTILKVNWIRNADQHILLGSMVT
jgi:hypothetical protein